jgi:cytochrome P450 family 313
MLAMHKNVQEKALAELREVFSSPDDPVDIDILTQLPYLEMVIKESMRLFPISPIAFRTSTHEFVLNDYVIPAGANFILGVYMLHRDKAFWGENAEVFEPERWEPERIKKIHPYAYLPFSGGPRYCIGSKYAMLFLKTCLSNLLRNFELETSLKIEELTYRLSITMKFVQPYLISLKPRNF